VTVRSFERSATDRTTNVTLLSNTRIHEDLPRLLSLGEGPERLLPAFLHEATHHWCFFSAVGTALAMLQMRIHRAALNIGEPGDGGQDQELARSLNRYETAVSLLELLDEGMALFAEFDITTRMTSQAVSRPLELAATFFAAPHGDHEDEFNFTTGWVQGLVRTVRLSAQVLDRKVNVLGQPLSSARSPYLVGYMLVRQLWLSACRKEWRLASETDLFLMYLRSFIYEDFGLVEKLLDRELDELRGPEAIFNHIVGRLNQFCELNPDDVQTFDSIVAASDARMPSELSSTLMLDEGAIRRGRRLLRGAAGASEPNAVGMDEAIRSHEARVLRSRQFLYLGSWQADVEVTSGRFRIYSGGDLIREGAARAEAKPGIGSGTVDVLQWIPRKQRVCAVFRGQELVASESLGVRPRKNDRALIQVLMARDTGHDLLCSLDTLVESCVRETWVNVAVEHVRRQVAGWMDTVCLPMALCDASDAQLPMTLQAMSTNGFLPLFKFRRDVIEGFAMLGLGCSALMPARPFLQALFSQRGLDLSETLRAASEVCDTYGVAWVWIEGEQVLSSV